MMAGSLNPGHLTLSISYLGAYLRYQELNDFDENYG